MKFRAITKEIVLGTQNGVISFIELLLVTGLAVLAWRYQSTVTYESATGYFFWPALGPVLLALRYGFGRGLIGLLLAIISVQGLNTFLGESIEISIAVILGAALLTMLTGEFRDSWHVVNQRLTLDQEFTNSRLEMFTQSYHLLKVSHDQLEQRQAGQQMSLRTAVQEIGELRSSNDKFSLEVAERTLAVLSKVITVYQAGFFEYTVDGISPVALAQVGNETEIVANDPMLRDAIENKITVGAKDLSETGDATSPYRINKLAYQLVVPLVDVMGNIKAIIVAPQVRFIQLTQGNIAIVHLLASYIANLVSTEVTTPKLQPGQRELFLQYLSSQNNYFKHFRLDSSLVVFSDLSQDQSVDLDHIADFGRGADTYWLTMDKKKRKALFVLMPITSSLEAERYINRISKILVQKSDISNHDFEIIGPLYINKQGEQIQTLLNAF